MTTQHDICAGSVPPAQHLGPSVALHARLLFLFRFIVFLMACICGSTSAQAANIYALRGGSGSFTFLWPEVAAAITAAGNTITYGDTNVDFQDPPPIVIPVPTDPSVYQWVVLFGEVDYSGLAGTLKTYLQNGGKIFLQSDIGCCVKAQATFLSLDNYLVPGSHAEPALTSYYSGQYPGPDWPGYTGTIQYGACSATGAGNAFYGYENTTGAMLAVNNPGLATDPYNYPPGSPDGTGKAFATVVRVGKGFFASLHDMNFWYKGDAPWAYGDRGGRGTGSANVNGTGNQYTGITPVDLGVVNFFFGPQSCLVVAPPKLTVSKALGGGRISNTDQFTVQIKNGATVVNATTTSTTTGTGSTVTAGSGTTGLTTLVDGTSYTINETAPAGTLGQYSSALQCTNALATSQGGTDVSGITSLGQSIKPTSNDVINCVITNTPKPASITLSQTVTAGVNVPASYNYTGSNGWLTQNLTTTQVGVPGAASPDKNLTAPGVDTVLTPQLPLGLKIANAFCTDSNFAVTGNPNGPLGSFTDSSFTIPASQVKGGSMLVCTVVIGPSGPTIVVSKQLGGTRIDAADQFTLQLTGAAGTVASVTTTGTGSTISSGSTTPYTATAGASYSLNEVMATGSSNLAQYTSSVACSNSNAGGTDVSTVKKLGDSFTPALGDSISCVVTNTPKPAQLTIQKISIGGIGNFAFSGSAANANGLSTDGSYTISTTTPSTAASGSTISLSAIGKRTEVQEAMVANWTLQSANCVDANAAVTGNAGSFGTLMGQTLQIAAANVPAGANLQCTFVNVFSSPALSGKVILDTGVGSGVAHDGVQNGAEPGQAGVALSLTDCAGVVYSSTSTAGDGSFSLGVAGVPSGQSVCVVQRVPSGYSAVSAAVGNSGGHYSPATASLGFVFNSATVYSGLVLGNVPMSTFAGDGAQQVAAGQSASYSHIYVAGTAGSVRFGSTDSAAGWGSALYGDANCNGQLDAGESLLAGPIAVVAGQQVCVIARVFSPAGGVNGTQNTTSVSASESWVVLSPASNPNRVLKNQDSTSLGAVGGLSLLKDVRRLSSCPATAGDSLANGAAYGNGGSARPGDWLEYRLRYANTTAAPLSAVSIHDVLPAYTRFVSALCLVTPTQGVTACNINQPVLNAVAGQIDWSLSDAAVAPIGLQPSASGAVSFCVQVQQ